MIVQWRNQKVALEGKVEELNENCYRLQDNSHKFLESYSNMKTERDQVIISCQQFMISINIKTH